MTHNYIESSTVQFYNFPTIYPWQDLYQTILCFYNIAKLIVQHVA